VKRRRTRSSFPDKGLGQLKNRFFLNCSLLEGKLFALFTLERTISIIKSENKAFYDGKKSFLLKKSTDEL